MVNLAAAAGKREREREREREIYELYRINN